MSWLSFQEVDSDNPTKGNGQDRARARDRDRGKGAREQHQLDQRQLDQRQVELRQLEPGQISARHQQDKMVDQHRQGFQGFQASLERGRDSKAANKEVRETFLKEVLGGNIT